MSLTPAAYTRISAYLHDTYSAGGMPLFRRGAVTYPVVVFPPQPQQINDVDSLLALPAPQQPAGEDWFARRDAAYLRQLQAEGRRLYDGRVFALARLHPTPLRIEGTLGSYYDMLMTCAALDHELRSAFSLHGTQPANLPLRDALHAHTPPADLLTSGRGRMASLGIATVVIFNDGQTYRALIAERAANTALGAALYHVLPAFMFEPSSAALDQEWSITRHIYREYLEELFGLADLHGAHAETPDYFMQHPALLALRAMLADGRAALYCNGVAINLMTTRPEICTTLLIHDPDWYARATSGTDDGHALQLAWETARQQVLIAPIASDDALLAALPPDAHLRFVPQGAVALWLAVDRARAALAGGGG